MIMKDGGGVSQCCEFLSDFENDRAVDFIVIYKLALQSEIDLFFVQSGVFKYLAYPVLDGLSVVGHEKNRVARFDMARGVSLRHRQ